MLLYQDPAVELCLPKGLSSCSKAYRVASYAVYILKMLLLLVTNHSIQDSCTPHTCDPRCCIVSINKLVLSYLQYWFFSIPINYFDCKLQKFILIASDHGWNRCKWWWSVYYNIDICYHFLTSQFCAFYKFLYYKREHQRTSFVYLSCWLVPMVIFFFKS